MRLSKSKDDGSGENAPIWLRAQTIRQKRVNIDVNMHAFGQLYMQVLWTEAAPLLD